MDNNASCVLRTFTKGTQQCHKHSSSTDLQPFLYKHLRKVFYSVNEPTSLYVRCLENQEDNRFTDKGFTIEGNGQLEFRPSCTVTLPNGSTIKSRTQLDTIDLTELPIFQQLEFPTRQTDIEIERNPSFFKDIPNIELETVNIPNLEDLWTDVVQPRSLLKALFHTLIWSPLFIFVSIMFICCFPRIKKQCENCFNKTTNKSDSYKVNDPEIVPEKVDEIIKPQNPRSSIMHLENETQQRLDTMAHNMSLLQNIVENPAERVARWNEQNLNEDSLSNLDSPPPFIQKLN
jgi:hypothetical protein